MRVSVLYFANKCHLFYLLAWLVAPRSFPPPFGGRCACRGQLRMVCTAVGMSTPPRCWVSPAGVGDVQAGGIGQDGRQECAGRDPVYFRGAAAALEQQGPCQSMGRAVFPAPHGAVMWPRCRPWRAGGFLPCPRAEAGGWDLPLPPLLCIIAQHLKNSPVCPSAPTLQLCRLSGFGAFHRR